jgi:hypothetical protein
MNGSSVYEKINMVQNFLSLINICNKVAYDNSFLKAQEGYNISSEFVDFNSFYAWQQVIIWADCLVIMCAGASFIRQLITWVPKQFQTFTDLIVQYVNLNQILLWLASIYLLGAVAVYLTLVFGNYVFMFSRFPLVLINSMRVFLDGFFYTPKTTFLIEETTEEISNSVGNFTQLFAIFLVRMFSQYILFNLMIVQIL